MSTNRHVDIKTLRIMNSYSDAKHSEFLNNMIGSLQGRFKIYGNALQYTFLVQIKSMLDIEYWKIQHFQIFNSNVS